MRSPLPFGIWEEGPLYPCQKVVTSGVHDDQKGLCTVVSWAFALPDLTAFVVAVALLVVGCLGWRLSQSKELQV